MMMSSTGGDHPPPEPQGQRTTNFPNSNLHHFDEDYDDDDEEESQLVIDEDYCSDDEEEKWSDKKDYSDSKNLPEKVDNDNLKNGNVSVMNLADLTENVPVKNLRDLTTENLPNKDDDDLPKEDHDNLSQMSDSDSVILLEDDSLHSNRIYITSPKTDPSAPFLLGSARPNPLLASPPPASIVVTPTPSLRTSSMNSLDSGDGGSNDAFTDAFNDSRSGICFRVKTHRLKCDHCGAYVLNRAELNLHLWTVHRMAPFVCGALECGLKFECSGQLSSHIRLDHPSSTIWQCIHCSKTFSQAKYLLNHQWKYHEQGIFSCPLNECTYIVEGATRSVIQKHLNTQHAAKYVCRFPTCGKALKGKYYLDIHEANHYRRYNKDNRVVPIYTPGQITELERVFGNGHRYLQYEIRQTLAQRLGLSESSVEAWFEKRRRNLSQEAQQQEAIKQLRTYSKQSNVQANVRSNVQSNVQANVQANIQTNVQSNVQSVATTPTTTITTFPSMPRLSQIVREPLPRVQVPEPRPQLPEPRPQFLPQAQNPPQVQYRPQPEYRPQAQYNPKPRYGPQPPYRPIRLPQRPPQRLPQRLPLPGKTFFLRQGTCPPVAYPQIVLPPQQPPPRRAVPVAAFPQIVLPSNYSTYLLVPQQHPNGMPAQIFQLPQGTMLVHNNPVMSSMNVRPPPPPMIRTVFRPIEHMQNLPFEHAQNLQFENAKNLQFEHAQSLQFENAQKLSIDQQVPQILMSPKPKPPERFVYTISEELLSDISDGEVDQNGNCICGHATPGNCITTTTAPSMQVVTTQASSSVLVPEAVKEPEDLLQDTTFVKSVSAVSSLQSTLSSTSVGSGGGDGNGNGYHPYEIAPEYLSDISDDDDESSAHAPKPEIGFEPMNLSVAKTLIPEYAPEKNFREIECLEVLANLPNMMIKDLNALVAHAQVSEDLVCATNSFLNDETLPEVIEEPMETDCSEVLANLPNMMLKDLNALAAHAQVSEDLGCATNSFLKDETLPQVIEEHVETDCSEVVMNSSETILENLKDSYLTGKILEKVDLAESSQNLTSSEAELKDLVTPDLDSSLKVDLMQEMFPRYSDKDIEADVEAVLCSMLDNVERNHQYEPEVSSVSELFVNDVIDLPPFPISVSSPPEVVRKRTRRESSCDSVIFLGTVEPPTPRILTPKKKQRKLVPKLPSHRASARLKVKQQEELKKTRKLRTRKRLEPEMVATAAAVTTPTGNRKKQKNKNKKKQQQQLKSSKPKLSKSAQIQRDFWARKTEEEAAKLRAEYQRRYYLKKMNLRKCANKN